MDKGMQDPSSQLVYGKFEQPVAESKYIVSVKSKQLNWRNFLYFGGSMLLFPAHVLKSVDGAAYIRDWNFKVMPGSGPYTIRTEDIQKGRSVSVRRRNDYWAEKERRNIGLGNFDEVRAILVRDQSLAFEMFKKGDLDFYYVNISREWIEELNFDKVQRGLIQKVKVFNDNPIGISGLALNTRKAPFDDVRVRRALSAFMNRNLLIEKLFYKEYEPMNSYYAGGIYENPSNAKHPYDPSAGLKLLNEAGWTSRDAQGRLVKDGRPLILELLYYDKGSERWLTIYQEDLRKVGVTLNLRLVTGETFFKLLMQRKYDFADMAWGGLVFPNPETSFASSLADTENNNNITGFKDKRVDELLPQYDLEFDQPKRAAIIKEIDGILAREHHYVLKWQAPFQRLAYWNKFGVPPGDRHAYGRLLRSRLAVVGRSAAVAAARDRDERSVGEVRIDSGRAALLAGVCEEAGRGGRAGKLGGALHAISLSIDCAGGCSCCPARRVRWARELCAGKRSRPAAQSLLHRLFRSTETVIQYSPTLMPAPTRRSARSREARALPGRAGKPTPITSSSAIPER